MAETRPEQLPAQLNRMAGTLHGFGCTASAEVVEKFARTAHTTGFVDSTSWQSLPKDRRRQELEQMRSEVGGPRRIAALFDKGFNRYDYEILIPASFVQAMINHILRQEFPEAE